MSPCCSEASKILIPIQNTGYPTTRGQQLIKQSGVSHPNKAPLKSKTPPGRGRSTGKLFRFIERKGLVLFPIKLLIINSGQVWVTASFLMTQFSLLITKDALVAPWLDFITLGFSWRAGAFTQRGRCLIVLRSSQVCLVSLIRWSTSRKQDWRSSFPFVHLPSFPSPTGWWPLRTFRTMQLIRETVLIMLAHRNEPPECHIRQGS